MAYNFVSTLFCFLVLVYAELIAVTSLATWIVVLYFGLTTFIGWSLTICMNALTIFFVSIVLYRLNTKYKRHNRPSV